MRKILLTFFAALLCAASMWAAPAVAIKGKLPGAFTINSDGDQVWFSQGNLQATTSDLGEHWTWSFAENQYDYIGNATANYDIIGNGTVSTNGSVDVFGWSTAATYYGIHSSIDNDDYSGDFVDWGANAITNGGNTANAWRTLTKDEWDYLFNTRATGQTVDGTDDARYTEATINLAEIGYVRGTILFPDDFDGSASYGDEYDVIWSIINYPSAWATYCTTAGWAALEAAGCVFLPNAGYRNKWGWNGGDGYYWSSTAYNDMFAYNLFFRSSEMEPTHRYYRYGGMSVRLVSETAPVPPTMEETPLTFEAMEAGATVTYTLQGTAPIQYSLNGGAWTDYDGAITLAAVGDKVSFRGNNASYNSDDAKFTCSADCYIYGNIMSLVDATNYATATTLEAESTFAYLFSGNAHIKNHATKDLVFPATTLADKCYKYMFYECTGLTSAPALPATTLAYDCYCYMFGDCSGLTSAPVLPATTLASRCYANMFSYCTGLTTAPALPATNLEYGCYSGMFSGCNGLTSAPVLPATTLAIGCYAAMFFGCASLTSAPELPATTLVDYCYVNMFCHCTNLSSVTCYATATASDATTNWLEEVAATGTFYGPKNSVFASEERGPNAIPVGWIFTPFQSSLTTAPTAITGLEYTGAAQALLNNDGVAEGGTLNYSLDNTNWSEAIPTATNAGDYTVYYKVVGDASHADFIPSPNEIAVSIAAPSAVALTANPDPDPQHAGVYYSTFYHSAVAYELSAGVEAYVAELSGDALIMTKIAEGGQVIPMDNAVILKANSGSITLTPSDDTPVTFTTTNNLLGVDVATAAPSNCYVLSGHSTDNSVTGVGFYQFTGTLKAHKAYATISGGAAYAPKKLRFVFNQEQTTTDIEGIQPSGVRSQKVIENGVLYIIKNGVRYNAQGQVVK